MSGGGDRGGGRAGNSPLWCSIQALGKTNLPGEREGEVGVEEVGVGGQEVANLQCYIHWSRSSGHSLHCTVERATYKVIDQWCVYIPFR